MKHGIKSAGFTITRSDLLMYVFQGAGAVICVWDNWRRRPRPTSPSPNLWSSSFLPLPKPPLHPPPLSFSPLPLLLWSPTCWFPLAPLSPRSAAPTHERPSSTRPTFSLENSPLCFSWPPFSSVLCVSREVCLKDSPGNLGSFWDGLLREPSEEPGWTLMISSCSSVQLWVRFNTMIKR